MAIAFLDMGAVVSSASASTLTPVIQTHEAGDTLIAIMVNKNGSAAVTNPGGWSAIWHNNTASLFVFTTSLVATGSDSNPVITWTGGAAACYAVIARFRGTNATIWGANGGSSSGSTSTHTSNSFNSTAVGSLAMALDFQASATAQPNTPAGWTLASAVGDSTSALAVAIWIKTLQASGSASGAISVTETAVAWFGKQTELFAAPIVGLGVKQYLRR